MIIRGGEKPCRQLEEESFGREGTASKKALRQEVPGVFEKQHGTGVVEIGRAHV